MTKFLKSNRYKVILLAVVILIILFTLQCGKEEGTMIADDFAQSVIDEMIEKFGDEHSERIKIGVVQVQKLWRDEDGSKEDLKKFCLDNFISDGEMLEKSFRRLEDTFEDINGILVELNRELQWPLHVDTGPLLPIDHLIANFNLESHVEEDLYKSKVAFFVLLNFEIHDLEDCIQHGDKWNRRKWAEVRLAQTFTSRVPSEVQQQIHEAFVAADNYISNYNIYMHNLITENGERLFPEDLKLISHWGLRDELKAQYNKDNGYERQKMIYGVMKKIITQEIPEIVINNPNVDWQVSTNKVFGENADSSPEPDLRYKHLLEIFHSEISADAYYPLYPTYIDRRFNRDREIPEEFIKQLFVNILTSDEFKETGELVKKQLGRDLEPFDIWYTGFRTKSKYNEDELTEIVSQKYPNVEAFEAKIPEILMTLGFDEETAKFLHSKIEVDPARGAGHAMGAGRRSDKAHLRTRVPEGGMDYKGFNIACHELGHNVEQTFSLYRIDHTLLQGVPNTAFTEAFAFAFENRDLQILGLEEESEEKEHLNALDQLWSVCEIAGVSLVDMEVWHWMYDHPQASPTDLKNATIEIAKNVWNEYFYPVFGHKDEIILAIYSHMIDAGLYLPDYPIGHIIHFQIEDYIKDKNLATEVERMCKLGRITPDLWMKEAVGEKISVKPLLKSAKSALKVVS
jgi:hypothetical protein